MNYEPADGRWSLAQEWSRGGPAALADSTIPQLGIFVSKARSGDADKARFDGDQTFSIADGVRAYGYLPKNGLPEGGQGAQITWVAGGLKVTLTSNLVPRAQTLAVADAIVRKQGSNK